MTGTPALLRVIGLLLVAASVARGELYVNNVAGDDRNSGLAPETIVPGLGPLQTINRALALSLPGERIILANTGVPYHEELSLCNWRHCGIPGAPLIIEGNGAVLDGSDPLSPGVWLPVAGAPDVFYTQPPRARTWQLFLDGKPLPRAPSDEQSAWAPALETRQWCLHRGKVYLRTDGGRVPGDYDLSYSALQTGITLYHVHDVMILDLIVQGFQLDGVNAFNGANRCRLGGVVCRGNGRAGLSVLGDSRLNLDGCVLGDNGTVQVRTADLAELDIVTSELFEKTAPAIEHRGRRLTIDGQAYQPPQ